MGKKTVIIGGVAGGATAAARLRRRDEDMQILILERGEYISYANCGLPYYIGDTIGSREALLLQTPEAMRSKYNIEVRICNEVVKIWPEDKKILVQDLKNQKQYEETYDNLIIATGSSPVKPPIPGIDGEGIYTLWTVPDTDRIKKFIMENKPRTAAVIGGGFIGLEMAENLKKAGMQVTVIEMQNQVMAPLDLEMANLLHENMYMNQVELILGDGVKAFQRQENTTRIQLNSGKKLCADLVILSIGVRPNSELAQEAGLKLNPRKGIEVNGYMETSAEGIYAVGDVIGVDHYITKETTMIPLAGPANKQARIVADNICSNLSGNLEHWDLEKKKYKGSLGTAIAKVFDLNAASVGLNEKQLEQMGKKKGEDYYTALINQKSHAGYYPGATPITLKMIFQKDGKILGAQIVGQDGVDKRIDTLASTIRLGGSIYDLQELELSYAPPFSSAKDPVNMLGFVAENIIQAMVSFISWKELDQLLNQEEKKDSYTILDVTEEIERMVYAIPGSYHIPLGQLRERMGELDKYKQMIVYCAIGVRSYNGARILMQNGFKNVTVLEGGTAFYKSMHYESRWKQKTNCDEKKIAENEDGKTNVNSMENQMSDLKANKEMKELDCCGLQCPGPIMKVHESMKSMNEADVLKVSATDMGFAADIDSWCRRTGNTLIKTERVDKENVVYIKKGTEKTIEKPKSAELPQGKTLIVFSGDLDKVLASFIIANGAAAMGRPVTMFFTFWGLNALRKSNGKNIKKPFVEKMFGAMMPKGSKKLKLSKMNMAGMGTAMMRKVMKDKNVDSLEALMQHALDQGIRLVACTMSMDIMGIQKEELIDGVEFAGVASYLGDAEEANVNLFV